MTAPRPAPQPRNAAQRAFWLRTLHRWHWISSALCLAGMLLFALTGITLNHAGAIPATPKVETRHGELPVELRALLDPDASTAAPLPTAVSEWIERRLSVRVHGRDAEFADGEAYLALPRPGGDAWLSLDIESGGIEYEKTDRGWVAYLNDLHKGRGTGAAWRWFIDIFAVACVIFCITGLFLLQMHGRQRPATWPMVGLGLVVPVVLVVLFIH